MSTLLDTLRRPSATNAPPDRHDIWRNDLAVLVWVLFILFLGLGMRNNAMNAQRTATLDNGLPEIAYPRSWVRTATDTADFTAVDAGSPSIYNTTVQVNSRTLKETEDLGLARAGWTIKRSQELKDYRELEAGRATVGDEPALWATYAYIADPSRDSAAIGPPVVVEATDLFFIDDGRLVVVTVSADASDWDEYTDEFDLIYRSLEMEIVDEGGIE